MSNIFTKSRKFKMHMLAYATLLVAFFLRVYRLADKNVWWDEGWSLWLARQDFIAIALRTATDEHPPLHYWMLRVWDSLIGWDAFIARFLSVLFGVLTVALIYRIGKRVGGKWIGALAALFLATARFHVWWSQDIKNYTPSIFFAFAAVWFGLEILARRDKPKLFPVIAYAMSAALALWTHYLAALIILAQNLFALVVLIREFQVSGFKMRAVWSAYFRTWILANLIAMALFMPWLVIYLQSAQAWTALPVLNFGLFLKLVATALPLGVTTNIEKYAGLTTAFTTIAALGIISSIIASSRSLIPIKASSGTTKQANNNSEIASRPSVARNDTLLFAIIVLLPPILIYILSLTPVSFFAPKIQARYLLILYPAYAILLALGIGMLGKFSKYLALAAIAFIVVSSAFVLQDYYAERRLRDEYATLANTIDSFARQGDIILLDTDEEWPTFLYYLRAPLEWVGAPNGKTMTDSDADLLVRRTVNRHNAVWLVTIPDALATDPSKKVEARLAHEFQRRLQRTFGDKRVALYASEERDLTQVVQANLRMQHSLLPIPFPNPVDPKQYQAQLIGFDLPLREAKAGDAIYVATYWFAVATRGEMELIDSSNRVVNSASFDLATGKDVRVVTPLNIPPIAAGEYAVRVRVGEKSLELVRVNVEPRAVIASVGKISNPVDYRLGEAIHFIGFALPQRKFRAGEAVPLTLYWRTDQAIAKNYVVFAHLLGSEMNASQNNFLWGQIDHAPVEGTYPTTAWRPNEPFADSYRIPIATNAPAGKYKIEAGMYDVVTGTRLKLDDGQDSIIVTEIEIVP